MWRRVMTSNGDRGRPVAGPGVLSSGRNRLVAAAIALLIVGIAVIAWAVHRPAGNHPPGAGAAGTSSALPAPVTAPAAPSAASSDPAASGPASSGPGSSGPSSSNPASPSASGPAPTASPVATPTAHPVLALAASAPRALRIPELGIDTSLIRLGLNADGTVGVPPAPDQVGWFDGSPTPGQLGPSTILGHVSWLGTPAEFYKIGTLKRGQTLSITRADGSVATFTVQGIRSYPKNRFPTAAVYGNLPYAGLRLITCSGDYDATRHYFPDNLVVFAQLTSVRQG